jgi:hypothetical protein
MKLIYRYSLISMIVFQVLWAEDCLDRSYGFSVNGMTENSLKNRRAQDLIFSPFINLSCCCDRDIINLFKKESKEITHRVNPAMDTLTKALRNQLESSDLKIKELVHLKYVNALYSFYDKDGAAAAKPVLDMEPDGDGCIDEFTFKVPVKNRKQVSREGILKEILSTLYKWKDTRDILMGKNMIEMVE